MDTTQTIVALFILVSTCCLIDCIWHFYKLWHDQFLVRSDRKPPDFNQGIYGLFFEKTLSDLLNRL